MDKPPLVVAIDEVEFVHFERVIQGGKSFDMVIVLRAGVVDKGADEFVRISQIESRHLEMIQVWLCDVAEIVYTESSESMNWKLIIAEAVRDPYFWLEEDAEGQTKNIGMGEVLQPFAETAGDGDEEEDEEEESEAYESEDEEEEEDDDDDDESLASEGESDDDDDDEDASGGGDGSESEDDWDALEKKAEAADKKRKRVEGEEDSEEEARKKKAKAKAKSK